VTALWPALELVAARGWPAAEAARIGGWRLYASSGYSGRINACWPLGRPRLPAIEAVGRVEAWYAARRLPPRFKIVEGAAPGLVRRLVERGYQSGPATQTMVGPTADLADPNVKVAEAADADFVRVFTADQGDDPGDAQERLEALGQIPAPRFFATAREAEPAAIGVCAVEGDWAGILAMRTDPQYRRRGFARRVLSTLLTSAKGAGATRSYLQVEAQNAPAVELYRGAGFEYAYSYRYYLQNTAP